MSSPIPPATVAIPPTTWPDPPPLDWDGPHRRLDRAAQEMMVGEPTVPSAVYSPARLLYSGPQPSQAVGEGTTRAPCRRLLPAARPSLGCGYGDRGLRPAAGGRRFSPGPSLADGLSRRSPAGPS